MHGKTIKKNFYCSLSIPHSKKKKKNQLRRTILIWKKKNNILHKILLYILKIDWKTTVRIKNYSSYFFPSATRWNYKWFHNNNWELPVESHEKKMLAQLRNRTNKPWCPVSLHDDNCFGTKREAASHVTCFAAMMLKAFPTGTGI